MELTKVLRLEIANRMDVIPASGTLEVLTLAKELEQDGKDIIHLEVGQPDFDTPNYIKKSAEKSLKEGMTGYTPSSGTLDLRKAISKDREDKNIDIKPEEIIVTPGAKHALFISMAVTLNPGDEVIIPSPCWTYGGMMGLAGAKPVFIECSQEDEFKFNPDELAEKISSKTKMILINYPNNPTGAIIGKKELKGLAEIIEDKEIWVLTDEIYDALTYGADHESITSFKSIKDKIIYINGFSKTYAMTGWRLGYAAGPRDLINEMIKIQQNTTTCATSFVQSAGVTALEGPQDEIHEMIMEYRKRRDLIVDGLNSIDGIKCVKPKGAFYVFPEIKSTEMKSMEICKHLLKNSGIATTPGSAFGPGGEGHLRMSYANSIDRIKEALERLEETIPSL